MDKKAIIHVYLWPPTHLNVTRTPESTDEGSSHPHQQPSLCSHPADEVADQAPSKGGHPQNQQLPVVHAVVLVSMNLFRHGLLDHIVFDLSDSFLYGNVRRQMG